VDDTGNIHIQRWRKRYPRPPRAEGPSTDAQGRSPLELFKEQSEALTKLSPEELDAFLTATEDQSRASQAERAEEARHRREQRYRDN